jgi:hypothetical protein
MQTFRELVALIMLRTQSILGLLWVSFNIVVYGDDFHRYWDVGARFIVDSSPGGLALKSRINRGCG